MTIALLSEAVASIIVTKIDLFRAGAPTRVDRWALDRLHREMLARVERMRQRAIGQDMTVENPTPSEGVSNTQVILRASDLAWCDDARREAELLCATLGPGIEVHHIGSTAVAGLAAKPIVDLAIALPSASFASEFARARTALIGLGYRYLGVRGGFFFEKGPAPIRTHAVQVHAAGSAVLLMLLDFRDALRCDEVLRSDYAAVKSAIARCLPRRRWIYAIYKGHWIQERQWRGLGARGWVDWFIDHRRVQAELTKRVATERESGWRTSTLRGGRAISE